MRRRHLRKEQGIPIRSVYRKLQVVIEESHRSSPASIGALVNSISALEHYSFSRTGRRVEEEVSDKGIRRVVRLAAELGFIDDTGCLTAAGKTAVKDDRRFAAAVRSAVMSQLQKFGVTELKLSSVLKQMLAVGTIEKLPTWDNIYTEVGIDAKEPSFRLLLTLLALSGGLIATQRKVYLPRHS